MGSAFLRTVQETPESIALHDASGGDDACTYAALADRAGGIECALTTVRPDDAQMPRVALLLPHGAAVVRAQLAAAALGWCYIPLDPSWPAARLRTMVQLADPDVVLTETDLLDLATSVTERGRAVLDVTDAGTAPMRLEPVERTRPAYIMFTSGSTGRPKGVLHTHRSVLHGISNHIRNFGLGAGDVVTLLSSFCFDMAVSDLYGGLLGGATVLTHDTPKNGLADLLTALAAHRPTVFHSTPTVFRFLCDMRSGTAPDLPSVRMALLGGEPVHTQDLARASTLFGADTTLVNGYGSTEASFSVQRFIDLAATTPTADAGTGVLDIGHPLHGYDAVVDRPDDNGVGEIVIHSDHLSSGYWRDPQRTAERYGDDGRTYRTGDLARVLADGSLEPAGRSDRQVKVNGVRVELDEIEDALEKSPFITRGVAFMVSGGSGPELVAHALRTDPGATVQSVREHLATLLPGAVIPQHLHVVDDLPLTLTGKADVLALRDRHIAETRSAATSIANSPAGFDDPTTTMIRCWTTVLGRAPDAVDLPFLEAGGNSLLLARLQVEIRRAFTTRVSLTDLLLHPTITEMTHHVTTTSTPGTATDATRKRRAAVADRMRRRSTRGH